MKQRSEMEMENDPFGLIRYLPSGQRMAKENLKMSPCLLSFSHKILISSSHVQGIKSSFNHSQTVFLTPFFFLLATAIWFYNLPSFIFYSLFFFSYGFSLFHHQQKYKPHPHHHQTKTL